MSATPIAVAQLLPLARAGDADALGRLLEQHRAVFQDLVERRLGNRLGVRAAASDVVQQAMLEAARDFQEFRGAAPEEFDAWLRRIVEHVLAHSVRDHLHAQKRDARREQAPGDPASEPAAAHSSPSQRAMRAEDERRLTEALVRLPDDQREAVRLRHLEGWTLARIAEHLGRTPVAAAGLIKRGMVALRKLMEEGDDRERSPT
jgi:RNA polymerase sigma-70 factor (ECF subfamily)